MLPTLDLQLTAQTADRQLAQALVFQGPLPKSLNAAYHMFGWL